MQNGAKFPGIPEGIFLKTFPGIPGGLARVLGNDDFIIFARLYFEIHRH